MRAKRIASLACVALLAGCAGQQIKMSEDHRKTLTTQTVHVVQLERHQGFFVESSGYTAAGVLFSPLVVIAQSAEGMSIARELGLEDPVAVVKDRLLAELESHYKLNVVRVADPASRINTADFYRRLGRDGVVLEVGTQKWGLDNNRPKYAASARVFRLSDDVVLWQARCDDTISDGGIPTSAELKADNGALLKARIKQAAQTCADQLADWAIDRAERRLASHGEAAGYADDLTSDERSLLGGEKSD